MLDVRYQMSGKKGLYVKVSLAGTGFITSSLCSVSKYKSLILIVTDRKRMCGTGNDTRSGCVLIRIFILGLIFLIQSCSSLTTNNFHLTKTEFANLPGWEKDDHAASLNAFLRSCSKSNNRLCRQAQSTPDSQAKEFFVQNFTPYLVSSKYGDTGLFTGYYETSLKGSFTKSEQYKYPVYEKPEGRHDMQLSREMIDGGALENKNLELLWVDDAVELFFLHIQGSGQIIMDDGSVVRVGFDGKNNYDYYAIGKYMSENGLLPEKKISATSIKTWLYGHPDMMFEVMEQNPSYIFFRIINGEGPIGAEGVALTPERSMAVDNVYINYGTPLWLDTTLTAGNNRPYQHLFIAQDTGSAIKGAVRGDIFFGSTERARYLAAHQNSTGRYYILLPK